MTPKESADNESEILFEDDNVLFLRANNFAAIDYYGGDYLKKHYNQYSRRNTIYLIVSKGDKKSYTIYVPEYGNASIEDYDGNILGFGDIIKVYPQIEMEVIELIGGDTAYGILKLIKSGKKVDKYDLNKIDECLDNYIFNEKNPGKSMIHLVFDEKEYFRFFDFSEDEWDISILSNVFSSGYGFEPYSSDSAYEDWKEGYILSSINGENFNLLKGIVSFIAPNLLKLQKENPDEFYAEVSKFLTENFSRQADKIVSEYYDLRNDAAIDRIKKAALSELPDVFQDYGIIKKYNFTSYYTTINLLLSLYGRVTEKTSTILELFKEIGYNLNINVGNYNEVGYESWDYDEVQFNSVVEDTFQEILDKIEDNPEEYEGAKKYGEVLNKLSKLGYEIDGTYKVRYDNEKLFKIKSIDKTNAKIILVTWKSNLLSTQENRSYSFEEFINFINSPELFESIIRNLKKKL